MPLALVLPLPAEVAARVALPASVPGALPASDLHVTVAALTSAPPDLLGSLAALAAHAAPIAATLSGTGRFASPAAEGDAFYLSVDAPALVELRARIESEHWRFIDRTHGLSPHVTLAYLAPDAAAPLDRFGPEPLRFEALTLWDGDTRTAFLFGSAMDNTTTLDAVALPDTPPAELRLFRDGWNDTTKGRFLLDADGAAEVLRRFAAHGVELAMDFDHGTFTEGGRRRDVPGYIGGLDYRPGDGLYATALRWTEVGLRAIAPGRAPDGTPHGYVPDRRRGGGCVLKRYGRARKSRRAGVSPRLSVSPTRGDAYTSTARATPSTVRNDGPSPAGSGSAPACHRASSSATVCTPQQASRWCTTRHGPWTRTPLPSDTPRTRMPAATPGPPKVRSRPLKVPPRSVPPVRWKYHCPKVDCRGSPWTKGSSWAPPR